MEVVEEMFLVVAGRFTNHKHNETVANDGGDNVGGKSRLTLHPDGRGFVELALEIVAFLGKLFFVPGENSFRIAFGTET